MNILYITWASFGKSDLKEALEHIGNNVELLALTENAESKMDYEFIDKVYRMIKNKNTRLVISFNYFPSVSEACMKAGCRYFSWIYDSPYVKAYDKTVRNDVNYIGIFDSYMVDELNRKGINTVHYESLAVNMERVINTIGKYEQCNRIELATGNVIEAADCDVSFVGSLYNNRNRYYERLLEKSKDMELAGYLDGVIDAQRKVYGYNLLDECLDDEITARIRKVMPYLPDDGSYIEERRIYSDYYLGPRLAFLDRSELISGMAKYFKVNLFTDAKTQLYNVKNCGTVDYYGEMPVIFNMSKINLNISLRSIRTGIPLRAMDIMGAGGFLLTNYQDDMFRHFEPGRHFDYYTSVEEAVDKAAYYMSHETERVTTALQAQEEMARNHTFEFRLSQILSRCM